MVRRTWWWALLVVMAWAGVAQGQAPSPVPVGDLPHHKGSVVTVEGRTGRFLTPAGPKARVWGFTLRGARGHMLAVLSRGVEAPDMATTYVFVGRVRKAGEAPTWGSFPPGFPRDRAYLEEYWHARAPRAPATRGTYVFTMQDDVGGGLIVLSTRRPVLGIAYTFTGVVRGPGEAPTSGRVAGLPRDRVYLEEVARVDRSSRKRSPGYVRDLAGRAGQQATVEGITGIFLHEEDSPRPGPASSPSPSTSLPVASSPSPAAPAATPPAPVTSESPMSSATGLPAPAPESPASVSGGPASPVAASPASPVVASPASPVVVSSASPVVESSVSPVVASPAPEALAPSSPGPPTRSLPWWPFVTAALVLLLAAPRLLRREWGHLEVVESPLQTYRGRHVPLSGGSIPLGRCVPWWRRGSSAAALEAFLMVDEATSRRQGEITRKGEEVSFTAATGSKPSFVNGTELKDGETRALTTGDFLEFGHTRMRFTLASRLAGTRGRGGDTPWGQVKVLSGEGEKQGRTFELQGNRIEVGTDVVLPDVRLQSMRVSNKHGCFTRTEDGAYFYTDLGSTHGSLVYDAAGGSPRLAYSDKPIPIGTNCQVELGGKTAGTMLLFTLY